MNRITYITGLISLFLAFISINCQENKEVELKDKPILTLKQELGKKLFFDRNLSTPPGQACSDCHLPETGFANPDQTLPVSRGVYKNRFGNRNDLITAYAGFSPEFHYDDEEFMYVGGMFWDGRAANLEEQAKGPFLNVLEMANPDEKTVVEKVLYSDYVDLFKEVFGYDALQNTEIAYNLIADAIADYERSSELNKFNSKYDYYLKGEITLTEQEMRGLSRAFNREYWNTGKFISAILRHGMPLPNVIALMDSISLDGDYIGTWKSGVKRMLKKYIKDDTKISSNCPECGQDSLVFNSGCVQCTNPECAYSKCG